MTDPITLPSQTLPNGLTVKLLDCTRHYYGGYWHVVIEISCMVPVSAAFFNDPEDFEAAERILGKQLPFVRRLEKMAVQQNLLDQVRQELLERFESNLRPFLSHEKFPSRFINSELEQQRKKVLRGPLCRS